MSTDPRSARDPAHSPTGDLGVFSAPLLVVSAAIVLTVTIFAFEGMAISTAMPAASAELGAGSGYGLAFSVLVTLQVLGTVLAGPWSDRSGPLPVVIGGQLIFSAGAGLCAVSSAYPLFLVGRALTGLGTGLAVVALYVIIGRFYPAVLRPRVFTYISAAWVLPSLLGPPVAAWLTVTLSWRWVFGVVCAPALVAAGVVAAKTRTTSPLDQEAVAPSDGSAADHRRLAVLGLGVAAAAGVLQFGAAHLVHLVSIAGAFVVIGAVGVLVTAPRVLTPGTLLMARGLASVMTARLLLIAAFSGVVAFVPLMLTAERGTSLQTAGLLLTLGSLGWFAGAWVQGRARWEGGRWRLVAAGGAALSAGLSLSTVMAAAGLPVWVLGAGQLLAGLGMGLATATTGVLALALAPVSEHGSASSSLQLSDSLGSILGLSVSSGVYAALHVAPGLDGAVYVVMWGALSGVAALVVLAGFRARAR